MATAYAKTAGKSGGQILTMENRTMARLPKIICFDELGPGETKYIRADVVEKMMDDHAEDYKIMLTNEREWQAKKFNELKALVSEIDQVIK